MSDDLTKRRPQDSSKILSKSIPILLTIFLPFFLGCNRVSVPDANNDKKPIVTVTVMDKTHGFSKQFTSDGDMYVLSGTTLAFTVIAYNEGGVQAAALVIDQTASYERHDQKDAMGKVSQQLLIASTSPGNNTPITKTYNQAGIILPVGASGGNYNAMLTLVAIKIHVVNSTDSYVNTCGSFDPSFNSDVPLRADHPIMHTSLTFTLQGKCASECCGKITFVQMIRFRKPSGEIFQPNGEQDSRMVSSNDPNLNGWAIDRVEGNKWAYYARNNDDSWDILSPTNSLGHIIFGTNSVTIKDGIGSPESDYTVEIASFAVCMGSSTCIASVVGYFGFKFSRVNNGSVLIPANGEIGTFYYMRTAFDLAVAEWNKQDGKNKLFLLPGI